MNPNLIVMLGGCVLLTIGCAGPPSEVVPEPELPEIPGSAGGVLREKPGFAKVFQLSENVKVGMSQNEIEAMFGLPDKAGYKVYGRSTETAWRALVWEWVFDDVQPARVLSVVFQDDRGVWRVNHGDWP
jgi:hypothetical protein